MPKTKDPVMIVEDDALARTALAYALGKCGLEVIEVESGEAALGAFRKTRPKIVVVDLKLPRMDGYQLIEEIRRAPGGACLPIIILSNLGMKPEVAPGGKCPVGAHLIKANTSIQDVVTCVISKAGGKEWAVETEKMGWH